MNPRCHPGSCLFDMKPTQNMRASSHLLTIVLASARRYSSTCVVVATVSRKIVVRLRLSVLIRNNCATFSFGVPSVGGKYVSVSLTCPWCVLSLCCNAASFGLTVLVLMLPLAGCSIHPIPDDVSRKTTYDIVQEIRCEAKAAVEQFGRGTHEASIVYQFTFDINEHNDATAGFSFLYPGTSGNFNLGASADLNRILDGNRNFELIDSFADLRKMDCKRDREVNWVYPLTGDVGMYDSVATIARLGPGPQGAPGLTGPQRAPGLGAADGTGYTALGPTGAFNSLLSTRMLQQESSAENRALYEQDRQRQLELQS
jgi:hypothetical protein